ncbi:zinc metallopeptidase [soil metagenome]
MLTTYYLLGGVALLGSLAVQGWLRSTYGTWSKRPNTAGITGAEVATAILEANGLSNDVRVEMVKGDLTDHYDPTKKVVRLSEANYRQPSVAGMAVAAHEVGHALQHATAYAPLRWRSAVLPVAQIGSQWGPMLAVFGVMLGATGLLQVGIWLFAGAVVFQLITLPVEFDASKRAHAQLANLGLVTEQDAGGARAVLNAAAMTYVAAAATAIMYLVYFIMASRR